MYEYRSPRQNLKRARARSFLLVIFIPYDKMSITNSNEFVSVSVFFLSFSFCRTKCNLNAKKFWSVTSNKYHNKNRVTNTLAIRTYVLSIYLSVRVCVWVCVPLWNKNATINSLSFYSICTLIAVCAKCLRIV